MIDLSSDTATRPTPAMRESIAHAEVGDEQRGEDPTVNELQRRVAELLGQEAALFAVTGTMCNRLAVAAQTVPGDVVVIERDAHLMRYETGGPAVMSGVLLEQIPGERGTFTPEQLAEVLAAGTVHIPPTTLVALEQTHNMAGGTIWPLDRYQAVAELAHEHGAAVHVDGARLLNAVVASGVAADVWGGLVDTVVDEEESPDAGTGLLFTPTEQGISWALQRALLLCRQPEKMKAMSGRGMRRDFGWRTAARRYEELYNDER